MTNHYYRNQIEYAANKSDEFLLEARKNIILALQRSTSHQVKRRKSRLEAIEDVLVERGHLGGKRA